MTHLPAISRRLPLFAACAAVLLFVIPSAGTAGEWKSGIVWPEPDAVDPGPAPEPQAPPSDATVLFDGEHLSAWHGGEKWEIKDGYAVSKGGGIHTKESFGDCQLHVEFATPPDDGGSGQGKGNSGVYMLGKYEVQILDSYENETYYDGQCGAIYKQSPPMVNASRPPGEWQSFDILFTPPRFDGDKLEKPGYMTVLHNGVVIHNHFELQGSTAWHKPPSYEPHPPEGPIHVQFHGDAVRFRNIWIREMKPIVGTRPGEQNSDEDKEKAEESD